MEWVKAEAELSTGALGNRSLWIEHALDGDVTVSIYRDGYIMGSVEFCSSGSRGSRHTRAALGRLAKCINGQPLPSETVCAVVKDESAGRCGDMHGRRALHLRMRGTTVTVALKEEQKPLKYYKHSVTVTFKCVEPSLLNAFRVLLEALRQDNAKNPEGTSP